MEITIDALVDSRANTSFIDINFVQNYGLSIKFRNIPAQVEVVDGRTIESRMVTHESKPLDLLIDSHVCKIA